MSKRKAKPPKVVKQRPRFLRPAGAGHYDPARDLDEFEDNELDHGYTSDPHRAMRLEPEAVDEVELRRQASASHAYWMIVKDHRHAQAIAEEQKRLEEQLDRLRCIARSSSVNVDGDIRVIKRRLSAIEAKIRKAA